MCFYFVAKVSSRVALDTSCHEDEIKSHLTYVLYKACVACTYNVICCYFIFVRFWLDEFRTEYNCLIHLIFH